jgi:hypothetical protein
MRGRNETTWIIDHIETSIDGGARSVPVIATALGRRDIIDGWKIRWGIGRNAYRVEPGLYAAGRPDKSSPVLVTANYKLSFDALRKELSGLDAWILVLDTAGVNVWCAAGKGTFGTRELLRKIESEKLAELVEHKTLILPQLGAPGVASREVTMLSGFSIVYGPVRAADLKAFFKNGMEKDAAMRRVEFRLSDRMAVAPVELAHALPFLAGAVVLATVLTLAAGGEPVAFGRWTTALIAPTLVGTLLFPALLPYLPFKAFAAKGAVLGAVWSGAASLLLGFSALGSAALVLVATSLIAYLAMNFTGSSTYTCKKGAELEVRIGLPIMIATATIGSAIAVIRAIAIFL